jgi:FtsH-binding integral membrane protein
MTKQFARPRVLRSGRNITIVDQRFASASARRAKLGFLIASIVSVFWYNSVFVTILNYVGVAIFIGLTAYDTQRLKQIAYATANDARMAARLSVNGALTLYLDFINLFLLLLRIMGSSSSDD